MNLEIFKDGGVWDTYSGDDGIMQMEEAKAMNEAIRSETSKHLGEEVPGYTDDQWKQIYGAYNRLSSKTKGFTREDAMIG